MEQNRDDEGGAFLGSDFYHTLQRYVTFVNKFRRIKRTIWYKGLTLDEPERNGEHSYQLLMLALFVNQSLRLGHDIEKLMWYAIVHDLPETYAGDTPAFRSTGGNMQSVHTRETKEQRELQACARIRKEWDQDFPDMVRSIIAYESQADPESKFIYALDKLAGVANNCEDGWRTAKHLDITFDAHDAYQRPRMACDETVTAIYDLYTADMRNHPQFKK